jgi:hypothetical protein
MITHFDDKGKIFTEVVKKIPVWVTIQLSSQQLHGVIHIPSEKRIKEEMNDPEPFLALTQVEVYTVDGSEKILSSSFIAVNKTQIVWIMTDMDEKMGQDHG